MEKEYEKRAPYLWCRFENFLSREKIDAAGVENMRFSTGASKAAFPVNNCRLVLITNPDNCQAKSPRVDNYEIR